MRTSTPKVLGWISVLYALLVHAWHAILPVMYLFALVGATREVETDVSWFFFRMLPLVYFLLYLLGGIGLLMLRRRGAILVLLGALFEFVYDARMAAITSSIETAYGPVEVSLLESLLPLIVPVAIAVYAWWLWKHYDGFLEQPASEGQVSVAGQKSVRSSKRVYYRLIALVVVFFGMIIPVASGIGVKLFLDSLGEPTIPWSYFVNIPTLILLIPLSVWWSIPYLMLLYSARNIRTKPIWGLTTYGSRLIFIASGFAGGALGSIGVFVMVFVDYDPLMAFVPIWLYYMPHLVAGLCVGWLIAKGVEHYSQKRTGHE